MAIRSASEITTKLLKSTEQLKQTVDALRSVGFAATVRDLRGTNRSLSETVSRLDKASDVFGGISKKITSLHKTSEQILSRIQERWQGFADKVFIAAATVAASAYEQSMKRITQEAPRAERSALYRITYNIQADLGAIDDEVRAAVEPLAEINMPLKPMKEWVKLSVKAGKVLGISAGDFGKMAANLHTINVAARTAQRSMSGLAALAHKGYMSLSEIPGVLETAGQLMQDLGVYGDKAFKKAVEGVGALRAALNNLGVSNWEQASSSIIDLVKGMVDYTNEESQRALAMLAATTGKTQTEIVRKVKTDLGAVFSDLMATLNKQIKYYAGSRGMIEMLMGDPRTLETYIQMIQQSTGISADVIRTAMSRSIEAYQKVIERTGDANKALQEYNKTLNHYTTDLYENYKRTVKQQEATKQFEKLYSDIKGMVNELIGTLQEAGHAFMVSVGMPFLRVGKIIIAAIVKPIHAVIEAFIKLNDITGGLLAVFAAFNMVMFGLRTSILLDLVNYWKSFAGWVGKTFPGVAKTFTSIKDGITSIGESLWSSLGKQAPMATEKLSKAATTTKDVFKSLSKSSATETAKAAAAIPKGLVKPLAKAQHMIQRYRVFMLKSAKNMFKGVLQASAVFIDNTVSAVSQALAVEGGLIKKSTTFIKSFLASNILSLQSGLGGLRKSILKVTAEYSGFGSTFVKAAGSAIGRVMTMFEGLMAFVATGPGMIIAAVVASIGALVYYLSTHTNREIERFFASLPEKVHGFLESIVQAISRLPDLIDPIMTGLISASETIATAFIENLPTLVVALSKAIWKTMGYLLIYAVKIPVVLVKSIWRAFDKLFLGLPGKIASGIGNAFLSIIPDSIVNAFATAWDWVKKKLPKWVKWIFGIDDLGAKKQMKQTAKGTTGLISQYEKYAMQSVGRAEGFYVDTTQLQLSRFGEPEPVKVPEDKTQAVIEEIHKQAVKARREAAAATTPPEAARPAIQAVTQGPQELAQKIPTGADIGEGLTGMAKVIAESLKRLFDKLFAELDLSGLIEKAKQAATGLFEVVINTFTFIRENVFTDENIQKLQQASAWLLDKATSALSTVIDTVFTDENKQRLNQAGSLLMDAASSALEAVKTTVFTEDNIQRVKQAGSLLVDTAVSFFQGNVFTDENKQRLMQAGSLLLDASTSAFHAVVDNVFTDENKQRLMQAGSLLMDTATSVFNSLMDKVFTKENKERLLQAGASLFESVKSGLKSLSDFIFNKDTIKAVADTGLKFVDGIKSGVSSAIDTVKNWLHPRATTPKLPELQPGDNPQVYEYWKKYISEYKQTGKATMFHGGKAYAATINEGLAKPFVDPVMLATDALSLGGAGIARSVVDLVVEGAKSVASQIGINVAKEVATKVLPFGGQATTPADTVATTQPVTMTAHEPIQTMPAMTTPATGENLVLADEDLKTSTSDMVSLLRRIERNTAKPNIVAVDKGHPEDRTDFRMKLIHDLTF